MVSNNYWMKLYYEMLDDPKVGRLSDSEHRTMVNCFLLAGKMDEDGRLPSVADIAWQLRRDEGELLADMEALAKVGILLVVEGGWMVTNFVKRQARVSDAERQRAYRDRVRHTFLDGYEDEGDGDEGNDEGVTVREGECDEGVTNRYADIDKDTDKDEDEDKDKDAELSAAAAVLSKKLFALAKIDKVPTRKLMRLFESLAAEGVVAEDIQGAWDWYRDKNGFDPRNFEVLQNPIMKERQKRLSLEKVTVRTDEYADFIQR